MKIEDVKIEDAADANYVIRKFFNDQFKNIKMDQLEQLVITVYKMGKNAGGATGSESAAEVAPPAPPVNPNPYKINDRVKIIEDVEAGQSGEVIKADTVGIVSSVKGDSVSFLCEAGEYGEMIEASVPFEKLERAG
jgi:hypothetical protein